MQSAQADDTPTEWADCCSRTKQFLAMFLSDVTKKESVKNAEGFYTGSSSNEYVKLSY